MDKYMSVIDKKETRKQVLLKLEYLDRAVDARNYSKYKNMKMDSELVAALKDDAFLNAIQNKPIERSTLLDFLPSYTRSIVKPVKTPIMRNDQDLKMLDAMEKMEHQATIELNHKLYIRWLLEGISSLESLKRSLIVDRYLFKLTERVITARHNISRRSLERTLELAYMDLAIIWDVGVNKILPEDMSVTDI